MDWIGYFHRRLYVRYVVSLLACSLLREPLSFIFHWRGEKIKMDGGRTAGEDPPGCIYNVEIGWVNRGGIENKSRSSELNLKHISKMW